MFNNLINRHDVSRVGNKLMRGELGRVVALVRPDSKQRVVNAWSHMASPPTHWWNVPGIRQRWNSMVTGQPDLSPRQWALDTYLPGRSGLRGLSIGCGTGHREREWASLGVFDRLDGIDLSEPRVQHANEQAIEAGHAQILNFEVADLMTYGQPGSYDVIIAEQALHHFAPMDEIVGRLAQLLHPDGILYLDEFVGPTRFQWSNAQIGAANELLSLLPEDRRSEFKDGSTRSRVYAPSLLAMRLKDPSEAIESARIVPEVQRQFDVAALHGYGGTVLHLAMQGIAQNFVDSHPPTASLIDQIFEFEDQKLAEGLPHDHVVIVARAKP